MCYLNSKIAASPASNRRIGRYVLQKNVYLPTMITIM